MVDFAVTAFMMTMLCVIVTIDMRARHAKEVCRYIVQQNIPVFKDIYLKNH